MIVGIGLDIVEVARIGRALERHGDRFETRVFAPGERAECAGRADRVQSLAGRFAAKEACMKALGTGWSGGIGFEQIEVRGGPGEAPQLRLSGEASKRSAALGVKRIHVSISHQPKTAVAVVVLDG